MTYIMNTHEVVTMSKFKRGTAYISSNKRTFFIFNNKLALNSKKMQLKLESESIRSYERKFIQKLKRRINLSPILRTMTTIIKRQ